jgi:hypothetical protein
VLRSATSAGEAPAPSAASGSARIVTCVPNELTADAAQ